MKKIGLFDKFVGIVLLLTGFLMLALPDPTSITDYLGLIVVFVGLNMLGADIDVVKLLGGK